MFKNALFWVHFLYYIKTIKLLGRNDFTSIKVMITKDMKLWESNQSLVHRIQYVVTSTVAERSQQVKNKRMRFLHVGRNDITYVMLKIIGDMKI